LPAQTNPDVIRQDLAMEPEEFDSNFRLAGQGRWQNRRHFDKWRTSLKDLVQQAKNKNYDEVLKEGEEVRGLYRTNVYPRILTSSMAEADLAKGNKQAPPPY